MNDNPTVGGHASLRCAETRDEESTRMLVENLGKETAALVLGDESLLPYLLPVVHSDGNDRMAMEALRKACATRIASPVV